MAAATTSLLDLIGAGLLQPGNKVMVRDIEGELTSQGTIISNTERGTVEYKTPTAFSKAVTNSTSGGWQQVKLKSSGGTTALFDIKRKFAGYSTGRTPRNKQDKPRRGSNSSRLDREYVPSSYPRHHHVTPVSHISVHHAYDEPIKVTHTVNLPVTVRFRDDDTKRGKLKNASEDFSVFELDYKGKTFTTAYSAYKEMFREYAEETGEIPSINATGLEDIKYQSPSGEWIKLRDLFQPEVRTRPKRTAAMHVNDDDYDDEDHDDTMSDESDPPTPPPLSPPSPTSNTTPPPQRNTMIAKHIKQSHPFSSASSSDPLTPPASSAPILPIKTPTSPISTTNANNGKAAPIVLSLKSPPSHESASAGARPKRVVKDIELLVHVESVESIPYEVIGTADSYESLRHRIAHVIPDFPFNQAHELGVYSEYWEKHAGVAYVKPPRSWVDFPGCTTVLLKRVPETIIISNLDL